MCFFSFRRGLVWLCSNQRHRNGTGHAFHHAEKQRRYRERHLGAGKKARIQLFLSIISRARLTRLARHQGVTVTALIEELSARAERRIVAQLKPKALKAYYGD
jgi:hypothetical protein